MRRTLASCLASLAILSVGHAQTLHFVLNSPSGDWVGGGQNWDVTYHSPNDSIFIDLLSIGSSGQPNYLLIQAHQGTSTFDVGGTFGTNQLGIPLSVGHYTDAQRASFAASGHPGEDLTYDGRGYNTLTGSFDITAVDYHSSAGVWVLDDFAASFNILGEGDGTPITGSFNYSSSPEPASFVFLGVAGVWMVSRRRARRRA